MVESGDDGHDGTSPDAATKSLGLLGGLTAYLGGLAGTFGIASTGILADAGAWQRVSDSFDGRLLAHQSAHVPLWKASPHPEMLPATAMLVVVVGLAGFAVARQTDALDDRDRAFRSGASVVVGYLPPALLSSLYLVVGGSGVEWVALVAPTLLAGVVFPAVVGGIGGSGAAVLNERGG